MEGWILLSLGPPSASQNPGLRGPSGSQHLLGAGVASSLRGGTRPSRPLRRVGRQEGGGAEGKVGRTEERDVGRRKALDWPQLIFHFSDDGYNVAGFPWHPGELTACPCMMQLWTGTMSTYFIILLEEEKKSPTHN